MTPKALSREIKFRGWDRVSKKMREHPQADDEHTNLNYTILDCQKHNDLMQFTGIYDKNGKEIYENDVLRWKLSSSLFVEDMTTHEIAEVVFYRGMFCLNISGSRYALDEYLHMECEVIGNIYESPDLLTKENK